MPFLKKITDTQNTRVEKVNPWFYRMFIPAVNKPKTILKPFFSDTELGLRTP